MSKPPIAFFCMGLCAVLQSASLSALLTKGMLNVRQRLLACGLVTGAVGCTRPRHTLLESSNRLRRYFAHPFLNGSHRARCRLNTHVAGHGARRSRRPGGGNPCELGVNFGLHVSDLL